MSLKILCLLLLIAGIVIASYLSGRRPAAEPDAA
jgi:hypothetical protein